jgi:hypothetical protein
MEYLEAKETHSAAQQHSHHSKTWRQMEHEQDEALLGKCAIVVCITAVLH